MQDKRNVNIMNGDDSMNHGQNRMSGRQPRRVELLIRSFWSHALILSLLIITFGFTGETYGAAGDIDGQYTHAAGGQQIAYAAAFGSDGSKVIVGSTKPTEGATEDYYVMKLSTGSNSLAWAAPVTFNLAGGTDQAVAVVIDSQANVVVTGSAFNGVNYDIHTIKYNGADGTVIWQNTFNGTYNGDDSAAALALDDDNNIYIGGSTQGANGYEDFLVIKYNSTGPIGGQPTWKATYNGTSNNIDRVNAIAVSHGANPYVAVTGISRNATNFDILTVKYNAGGVPQWAVVKNGGSGDDWGLKVKLDSYGDVVMAGYVNNGLNADIYLAKYTGNTASPPLDWQVTYSGGSGGDEPRDLAIDSADNVYVTGFTYSSSSGFNNYFTAKYYGIGASKGTLAWPAVKTYNSGGDNADTAVAIAVSADSVYVTGFAHKTAAGDDDTITIKYRKDNGTQIWESTFAGVQGLDDVPVGIGISTDGKVHAAGTTAIDSFNTDFVGFRIDPGALNTPSDLIATLISQTEIQLNWTLNSTTETGVEIYRKIGSSSLYPETPTHILNGTGITSYNDTGLTAHTKYYYKIRVLNASGAFSLFSNEVSKQTTVYNYAAPTWTYKYADAFGSNDVANAVAVGPDNHPVATGYINTLAGTLEYYTVKLNYSTKAVIWSAIYGVLGEVVPDAAQCVAVDSNNYPVVSGYSTLNNGGSDSKDFFTIKYDKTTGTSETPGWERPDNGVANGDDEAVALVATRDGANNIVVVGWGRNISANTDIFVVKYSGANGAPLWSGPVIKVYDGGADDRPAAVALDGNGDIIVTGRMYNGSNYDMFTRKYSGTNGATVWTVVKSGGFGDDEGLDVAVGSDNSVYVTGYVTNASGKKDIYTVKYKSAYDAADQKVWEKTFDGAAGGNDWAAAVRVDTNGDDNNIVVAGTTEQSTAGKHDYIVIRYDSTGTVLWTRILDRQSNNDLAKAMAMDVTGNICIAGNTDSNSSDIMTVKYGYDGEVIGTTLYNGAASKEDGVKGMGLSPLGHAYVAGYSENAGGNFDFLLLQCEGNLLQSPAPFTPTPYYLSIDFSWINNTLDADGFKMRRQVGSCATVNPNNWTTFTFSSATLNYTDTGLNMGTTYCYQIQAYKNSGTESRWLEKTVTTIHPPIPGSFTATATNTTTVHLAWVDNLNGEDRFELKRCIGSGAACDEEAEFTVSLPNQVPGTVQYDDVTACANTTYTYRIQGVKDGAWDSYMGYATVSTPAVVNPTLQTVVKQSEGRIDLNWTDTNTDLTGYKVYRCDTTAVPGCTPSVLAGTRTVIAKPSGNVLYLQMDESAWTGTAGQIIDSSGAGNNATAYGGVSTTTGGRDYSRAGSFNGTSHYIGWAYSGAGTPSNNFTVAAWVKASATHEIDTEATSGTTGTAGQKFLFYPNYNNSPASGAGVSVGTNGVSVYEHSGGYLPPLAVYSGSLGTGWNHIVVTYTNKQPKIYVNGSLVRTGLTSPMTTVYAPIRVGGDSGGYGFFSGIVDEAAVFNRALSDAEIATYYNYLANYKRITDLPLTPNTSYRYGVTVFKTAASSCNGGWETTATASGVLTATTDNVTAVTIPTLLTATRDATEVTSKINLTWQDNSETEESFYIERCVGGACDFSSIDKTDTVAANVMSYSDLSACQGAYRYRVSAKRTTAPAWQSTPSSAATATTNTMAVPSGLTWDSANSNEEQIKLTWTDTNPDEDGIEIWRCTGSGCSDFGASAIATVGRGVTTYTNTRLNPDTIYVYKVRAVKSTGCTWQSSYSSTVTANTNVSNKGALNLTASALNTTQIDLGWSDITSNESGFVLERCAGTCDSGGNFSTKYGIGVGSTTYSDVANVCQGTTYSYRLKAIDQEFAYGYNGCWTKRVQMSTITGFQANSVIEFTVNYAAGMQTDFDDLRFYQFTDGTLTDGLVLPHWIVKKADGTSATVWLKTGANANFIYMYYGNPNATKVPNGGGVFEFYDDFPGTTVDATKWENSVYSKMYLDSGLKFVNDGTTTYTPFTSKATFARDAVRTLYYRNTPSNSGIWYAGLSANIVDANNTFVHGLYYSGNMIAYVYENGSVPNYPYKYYSYGYPYEVKIVYSINGGAKYYIRGGGGSYTYNTWTSIYDSTVLVPPAANTPMRVKLLLYQADLVMDTIGVITNDLASTTITLGSVQGDGVACNSMPHEWASAYSNIVTLAAKTAVVPSGLTGTALSESDLSLSWTANTPDVTGVKLLRCSGDATACASGPFTQIASIGVAPVIRLEMNEASWTGNGTTFDVLDGVGGKTPAATYNGVNTVAAGHSGRGGSFDGVNDYIAWWSYTNGIPTDNFTLAAWVNVSATHEIDAESTTTTTGTSGQRYLFVPDLQTTGSGAGVSVGTNGISVYEHSGGYMPPLAVYSGTLTAGAWYHVVVTYTNKQPKIYLNGTLVRTGMTSPRAKVFAPTILGGFGYGYFAGTVDEVAVYNQSLSAAEVQNLYLLGSRTYLDSGLSTNAWYTYKLAAYKGAANASCTWDEGTVGYSAPFSLKTQSPPSPVITAVAVQNSTGITLTWTDLTGSNTVFQVQRSEWDGASWSAFTTVGTTQGNATSFTDQTACKATQYKYRLVAAKEYFIESLSNAGGVKWSRVKLLAIANFQADFQTKIVVPYDPDMKSDFSDIRFWDATAQAELPYWIESKTDGVTATVWFKTGNNNSIYFAYGNYNATSSSNGVNTFVLFEDFNDNTLDTGKWNYGLEAGGRAGAETGGIFRYGSAAATQSGKWTWLQTVGTYAQPYVEEYKFRVAAFTGTNTKFQDANAYYFFEQDGIGWRWNYYNPGATGRLLSYSPNIVSNSSSFVDLKFVRNGSSVAIYENNVLVSTNPNAMTGAQAAGFSFYESDATQSGTFEFDDFRIRKYAATEPVVTMGVESNGNILEWSSEPSAESNIVVTPYLTAQVFTDQVSGVSWARRKLLTISNFQTNFQTKVVIAYDSDMKVDFSDIRFFDATAGVLLPYWVESKTNSSTATVWVKTGAYNNIYLYYGNANAASASSGVSTFTFFDDFDDNSLDTTKWWYGCNLDGCLPGAETGGVFRFGTGPATAATRFTYLTTSPSRYTRSVVEEYKLKVVTDPTSGLNGSLSGVGGNLADGTAISYTMLMRNATGWYWNYWVNPTSTSLGYSPNIALNNTVKIKKVWDDTSVKIYENDTLFGQTPYALLAGTNYWLGFSFKITNTACIVTVDIDDYRIRQYAATEPSVALQAEEAGPFTAPSTTPVLSSVTRNSEAQIDLVWTWSHLTTDETGYKIERCEGVNTNCVTLIAVGTGTTYSDKGLKNDQQYCYRISAYKTAVGSCSDGWDTGYGTQSCATTTSTAPTVAPTTGVTTQASNSTQVDLVWTDNTNSEEGFKFWRCLDNGSNNCASDANYAEIATAGANRIAWSDTTVCSASTYYYKVQAYSNGPSGAGAPSLTNAGGNVWSRRARINFSAGFQTDYQTKITIPYDSDMQADFDDLRFYDEVAEQELPYWIEKKTDGTSATVWFKTGTSSASISMYYGNASATSSSSGTNTFGASRFAASVRSGTLTGPFLNADGYIIEAGVTLYSLNSAYSPQIRFDASGSYQGTKIYYYSNQYFYRNDNNSVNTTLVSENVYSPGYTLHSPQRWTIKVKDSSYWLLLNDALLRNSANLSFTSGDVVFNQQGAAAGGYFYYIFVRKYASAEPTVAIQAEEITPVLTWLSPKSVADDATTATVSNPVLDQTNTKRLTENQVQVVWTDVNPDESYFIVERGNAACDSGSFVVLGNTGAPNIYTYTDTGTDINATYGLPVGATYCYRVRPYKTASCLWPSKYSSTKAVTLDVPAPTNVTAAYTDTTTIHVEWDDTTKTETSFDVYRCPGSGTACDEDGEFSLLGFRGPHTTLGVKVTYDDSTVCPAHTYTYMIKAIRAGNWASPFSAGAVATTIAAVAPSALTEAEIYDPAVDQRKIKLYWTDTNADETGFKIERCNYTVSGNCNGVNYTEVGSHVYNLNETFDTQINSSVWTLIGGLQSSTTTVTPLAVSNISGSASVYWSGGKAVMRTTSVNLSETNYNYSRLRLADPELLGSGDYDFTMDYNLPSGAPVYAQYHVFARFQIVYPIQTGYTNTDLIYVERANGGYNVTVRIKDVTTNASLASTDTSGKFRLNRTANVARVYVWTNGAWNLLVTHAQTLAAVTMPTAVYITQYTQRNEAQDITTEIDNVKIVSSRLKFTDFSGTYPINPSSTYYYRVRAYKTHSAACSEWDGLYTNSVNEPTNPATPTSLIARASGSKKIELLWTDNATDENGYIVEKKAANGIYIEIATLAAANKQKYVDAINLDPNTSYTYRVRAFRNSDGSYSPYSNEATGKTFVWAKPNSDDTTCKPVE